MNGSMQSARSHIRILGLVVYQRPVLIHYAGITPLLDFVINMQSMKRAVEDVMSYQGKRGSITC